VILAFCLGENLKSQPLDAIPRPSQGEIRFYVDMAGFRSFKEPVKTYEEFYYTLTYGQLSFVQKEGKFVALMMVEAEILDPQGQTIQKISQNIPVVLDSLREEYKRRSLFFNFGTLIEPGLYRLKTTIEDYNSRRQGSYTADFEVPKYQQSSLFASQIQFAAAIFADTLRDQFYKNGLRVIPNPLRLYGTHLPMLFPYLEIYNLSDPAGGSPSYHVVYEICDTSGALVRKLYEGDVPKPGTSSVEARGFNVVVLPTGSYELRIRITDPGSKQEIVAHRAFRITNLQEQARAQPPKASELISNETLEKVYDDIQYIATREELKLFRRLDKEGKIKFLTEFWKKRDPNPETPENEFQLEHYRRINYANRHFGNPQIPGWKTDRGRIFIKYGPPDEVERYKYELDYKPYEIWYYYKRGGKIFVFGDLEGMGIYTLLHSNWEGEVHDPEWKDRLYYIRKK